MYGNIEKGKFSPYVGHAALSGAWRIRRNGKGWIAVHHANVPVAGPGIILGRTLREISEQLRIH